MECRLAVGANLSADGRHFLWAQEDIGSLLTLDAYETDLDTNQTVQLNTANNGFGLGSIFGQSLPTTADGNLVFMSAQQHYAGIWVRNVAQGTLTQLPGISGGQPIDVSPSGRYLLYTADEWGTELYVADLTTAVSKKVASLGSNFGTLAGRYNLITDGGEVVFNSLNELVPGAHANCQNPSCSRVYKYSYNDNSLSVVDTRGDGSTPLGYVGGSNAQISNDGSTVVWSTSSIMRADYVTHPGGEVYAHNLTNGTTRTISVNTDLVPAAYGAESGSITADGSEVAASSNAINFGTPPNCQPIGPAFAARLSVTLTQSSTTNQCTDVYVLSSNVQELVDGSVPELVTVIPDYNSLNLVVEVTDTTAGLAGGEFYVGGSDPGLGRATHAGLDFADPAHLVIDLSSIATGAGAYDIHFRAYTQIGNWGPTYDFRFMPQSTDMLPPSLSPFVWSQNPKATTGSTSLTIPATDNASGIARAEYFIGDTDPGQGNGAAMTLANVQNGGLSADLTTTFGTNFQPGVYKISVRAQDNAGNWSDPVSDYLVVYDPSGPNVTGGKESVPSLANGDVLPGLAATGQTDISNFGFTVKYAANGTIDAAKSDLQFNYNVGKCGGAKPKGCVSAMSLNATTISWLVTDGANLSHGSFRGVATLTVNGVTTTNPFTVEVVDGSKTTPTQTDHIILKVFAPGANPNTATPLYQINDAVSKGKITIG